MSVHFFSIPAGLIAIFFLQKKPTRRFYQKRKPQCVRQTTMNRIIRWSILAVPALTLACCYGVRPKNPEARPWTDTSSKVNYMFQLVGTMTPGHEVPSNECAAEIIRGLEQEEKGAADRGDDKILQPGKSDSNKSESKRGEKMILSQSAQGESNACASAARSCGNCHLPRVNSCTYAISVKGSKTPMVGLVTSVKGNSMTIRRLRGEGDQPSETRGDSDGDSKVVDVRDVDKVVWLNGGEPLWRWWDFKRFSHRGVVVRKMLAITAENNTTCLNCHKGHGDFTLTPEGRSFQNTGVFTERKGNRKP